MLKLSKIIILRTHTANYGLISGTDKENLVNLRNKINILQ